MLENSMQGRPGPTADPDVVTPPPAGQAVTDVLASAVGMLRLVAAHRLHHPRERTGTLVRFADGSTARVYRETCVDEGRAADPALLVVGFVLRGVRGPLHGLFRLESWLNLPMFVGFPGFTSKLWMAHDERGCYRGVYEWDGAERATAYVRSLSWVLGLVSVPGSIRAHVVAGVHGDEALDPSGRIAPADRDEDRNPWWRPVTTAPPR